MSDTLQKSNTVRSRTAGPGKSPKSYIYALGRRKTATARIRLYKTKTVPGVEGQHQIFINQQDASLYFPSAQDSTTLMLPLTLTETAGKLSASVVVKGSGKKGQLGAVVHGLSRALVLFNPEFRPTLKAAGLLTRDSRAKERRKAGKGGKARRSKQSPKR